jgi:secreted Zn-dependent insulinase-like peptidase
MTIVAEKDKNQEETFGRDWVEFATHKYLFERQNIEIEELKQITKEDFKDYFSSMFVVENNKRLDIHYNSKVHEDQEKAAVELKQNVYPTLFDFKEMNSYFADPIKANYATRTWKL